MKTHRKAICRNCGTELIYHGDPWHRWVHSELTLANAWNHKADPDEEAHPEHLATTFHQIEEA